MLKKKNILGNFMIENLEESNILKILMLWNNRENYV